LVAGPVADAVGVRIWYVIGGVICVLVAVVAALTPAIINIERQHEPTSSESAAVSEIVPLAK
jgi:DHA3 family macrolide efflux protein-like MFS transporter